MLKVNKKEKRFFVEKFLRLKERALKNKADAELDLKDLEKWKQDLKDLSK